MDIKGSLPIWGSWERLVPKELAKDRASQKLLKMHLHHYEIAARYSKGKQVLDIACGTGYGSQMIRNAGATSVVGVDKFLEIIQYATQNYRTPDVKFVCANAGEFEWLDKFDMIVSFETLEHLPHPDKFLARVRSLLKPSGIFLLSVPLGETRHLDPYHLHAFSQKNIFDLLEKSGFLVDKYDCKNLFLSFFDLLKWGKLYPKSQPKIYDLLLTTRGQWLMYDLILRGGISFTELFVFAYPIRR